MKVFRAQSSKTCCQSSVLLRSTALRSSMYSETRPWSCNSTRQATVPSLLYAAIVSCFLQRCADPKKYCRLDIQLAAWTSVASWLLACCWTQFCRGPEMQLCLIQGKTMRIISTSLVLFWLIQALSLSAATSGRLPFHGSSQDTREVGCFFLFLIQCSLDNWEDVGAKKSVPFRWKSQSSDPI